MEWQKYDPENPIVLMPVKEAEVAGTEDDTVMGAGGQVQDMALVELSQVLEVLRANYLSRI